MSSTNVKVVARFRPMGSNTAGNQKEGRDAKAEKDFDIRFTSSGDFVDTIQFNHKGNRKFVFDRVYDGNGSGKTYTMFGVLEEGKEHLMGIIPRAAAHIYQTIEEHRENLEFSVKCSFLEIYKENIRDLLNPDSVKAHGLEIRQSPERGIHVPGLIEQYVMTPEDITEYIQIGDAQRTTAKTKMNDASSRSHSVFIVTVNQKHLDEGSTKSGKLNLVDLAGSEMVKKTEATGNTLKEATFINRSLSALGQCIRLLAESSGKKGKGKHHIPYRDSKLTRLLQESLGGNCKTTLMVTASPSAFNAEETLSTLRFGERAKAIKNVVKVNRKRSVAELEKIIEKMKAEVKQLRRALVKQDKLIKYMRSPDYDPSQPLPDDLQRTQSSMNLIKFMSSTGSSTRIGSKPRFPGGSEAPAASAPGTPAARMGGRRQRSNSLLATPQLVKRNSTGDDTESPHSEQSDDEVDDYNPLELAETKMKLQSLEEQHESEMLDLKQSLADAQERLARKKKKLKNRRLEHSQQLKTLKVEHSHEIDALRMQMDERAALDNQAIILLSQECDLLDDQLLRAKKGLGASIELDAETAAASELDYQNTKLRKKLSDIELVSDFQKKRVSEVEEAAAKKDAEIEELQTQLISAADEYKKELELLKQQLDNANKAILRRNKIFKPARPGSAAYKKAFEQKVDLKEHRAGLRSTGSSLLKLAAEEHQRSMSPRGVRGARGDSASPRLSADTASAAKSNGDRRRAQTARQPSVPRLNLGSTENPHAFGSSDVAHYKKIFNIFDKDKLGYITAPAMREFLQHATPGGRKVTEDELALLMKQMDTNGDGKIDFEEFLSGLWASQQLHGPASPKH